MNNKYIKILETSAIILFGSLLFIMQLKVLNNSEIWVMPPKHYHDTLFIHDTIYQTKQVYPKIDHEQNKNESKNNSEGKISM